MQATRFSSSNEGERLRIEIPDPALVLLIGPSGAGKSTFAARHFRPTEVLSSDRCRAMICDDEADQSVSAAAFRLLHQIARARLSRGRMTVIDATSLARPARLPLLRMAHRYGVPAAALVFQPTLATCLARNRARLERVVPEEVIHRQHDALLRTIPQLAAEGYVGRFLLGEDAFSDIEVQRSAAAASPESA